jgi:hypothetical protein
MAQAVAEFGKVALELCQVDHWSPEEVILTVSAGWTGHGGWDGA